MLEPSNTVYIFERGILGFESITGAWQWPHQAVVWIHKNTPHKAQTITYFCGFIFPALTRWYRAKQFAKLLKAYAGWKIVLVCHSEGTATGLRALKIAKHVRVEELHLVCGAADADFMNNGLNVELISGRVGKAFVYVAENDMAMRLEDTYIGSFCFGLQTAGQPLGLKGPENMVPTAASKVEVCKWPTYGHSTCWESHFFDRTMRQITHAK